MATIPKASKKAATLAAPTFTTEQQQGSDRPSPGTGQSYDERAAKGRKELTVWFEADRLQKIESLKRRLGAKSTKELFERAIDEMFVRYIQR